MTHQQSSLYVPLDVNYSSDDAILAAGEQAELLFIRSLCLCKKVMTDGFLSDRQVHSMGLRNATRRAARLVEVDLFERDDSLGGYWVRSWLKHNRSAAEVRDIQEKRRSAGRMGGRPKSKVLSDEETTCLPDEKPNPKPIEKRREEETRQEKEEPLSSSSITSNRGAPLTDDDAEGSTLYLKIKTELLKTFEEEDARAALTVWWPRQSTGEKFTSPLSFCSKVATTLAYARNSARGVAGEPVVAIDGEEFHYDHANGHWHRVEAEVAS